MISDPNPIRCPKCKSEDVDCESNRKHHRHICHTCGFETIAAPRGKK